jgi:hypothetical protein
MVTKKASAAKKKSAAKKTPATKKTLAAKKSAKAKKKEEYVWPKKLSKAGEWLKANPGGILVIHDMKAVLR